MAPKNYINPFHLEYKEKLLKALGTVHKLRLQEEGGRWSKKAKSCKRSLTQIK